MVGYWFRSVSYSGWGEILKIINLLCNLICLPVDAQLFSCYKKELFFWTNLILQCLCSSRLELFCHSSKQIQGKLFLKLKQTLLRFFFYEQKLHQHIFQCMCSHSIINKTTNSPKILFKRVSAFHDLISIFLFIVFIRSGMLFKEFCTLGPC